MNTTSTPAALSAPPDPTKNLSQEEQDALKVAVFQRLHPRLYLDRFLAEKYRPDGRPLDAFREVSVNVGSISTADGSALVRMGHTTVVCGVKAEIAEPELDKENLGFLVPNVDLPAMCSPKFKPGPPSDEAQILSERLYEVLTASNLVPLESLCIHPGKSAWTIYVDATCINYDGNIFDATLLAMVAALKNTVLPQATFDVDTERTLCSRSLPKLPLIPPSSSERDVSVPIGVSFGVYDSTHLLADPTAFEEPLLETSASVVLGCLLEQQDMVTESPIVWVSQTGPTRIKGQNGSGDGDALELSIPVARRRATELTSLLVTALRNPSATE